MKEVVGKQKTKNQKESENMLWTKVTDATLPPDRRDVIVTVADDDGERFVEYRAMHDHAMKKWLYFDVFDGRYEEFSRYHTVTHWAERAKPAEGLGGSIDCTYCLRCTQWGCSIHNTIPGGCDNFVSKHYNTKAALAEASDVPDGGRV